MMKSGNIGQLSEQLDAMVSQLGLSKLAAEGPIGESAGVVADSGTAQPAEQEANRSEIQPATEGAQSASNNQMLKEEVKAQTTAEAKPQDADNKGAASSPDNTTTASTVGDDPKVEDDYGSRQQTLDAPNTTHPADVNKDPEKYSAQLLESASLIDQEIEKLAEESKDDKSKDKKKEEKKKSDDDDDKSEDEKTAEDEVTVGDRIGELLMGKEASAEEKDQAVVEGVRQYLGGYAKTASLLGDMTADYLDLVKKAEGEEEALMGEETAPGVPAEELAAEEAAVGGEGDDEAAALAQAAEMVAAQLGVTPEEVLEAAAAELEGGGMGGEMGMGGEEEAMAAEGGIPEEELAAAGAPEEEAKMASVKEDELQELRKQAEELKQLKEAQARNENDEHLKSLVSGAVRAELDALAKKHEG
jgi:hypothetical protein